MPFSQPLPSRPDGRPRAWLAWVLAAVLLVGAAPAAVAQSQADMNAAKKAYKLGDEAFRAGQLAEALAHFQKGYALSGKARFLMNIAHTQRKLGNLRESAAEYEKFLASDPKPEDRASAEQMLAEVRAAMPPEPPPSPVDLMPRAPEPEPAPALVEKAPPPAQTPIYKRWYFWAGVGAVVAAGVITTIVVSGGEADYKNKGTGGVLQL